MRLQLDEIMRGAEASLQMYSKPMQPEIERHKNLWLLIGGMGILCLCITTLVFLSPLLHGLPSDYSVTVCLAVSRSPISFSLWWTAPNLPSLPHRPLIASNRIDVCTSSLWSPWLPRRGGLNLRG